MAQTYVKTAITVWEIAIPNRKQWVRPTQTIDLMLEIRNKGSDTRLDISFWHRHERKASIESLSWISSF